MFRRWRGRQKIYNNCLIQIVHQLIDIKEFKMFSSYIIKFVTEPVCSCWTPLFYFSGYEATKAIVVIIIITAEFISIVFIFGRANVIVPRGSFLEKVECLDARCVAQS